MTPEFDLTPLRDDELVALPVFPLPRVVFFPGTLLPLHFFEPRYRALADHCTKDGAGVMAVTLLRPGYEDDYEGSPAIHTVAGVGRVVAHQRNPDGTHNLVLHGLGRVSLDEQPSEHPFRIARGTRLRSERGRLGAHDITTLIACATQVAQVVRRKHPDFELGVDASDEPGIVCDQIADRFIADPAKRQAVLEALDVGERTALVTDRVGELLAMLAENDVAS